MKKSLNTENPLLQPPIPPVADPTVIRQGTTRVPLSPKRLIVDLRRQESAAEAVEPLDRDGTSVYGLTKGQFSLTDLIRAILQKTGPASLWISTWTAAGTDVSTMSELMHSGEIVSCRWLVDTSFVRRCPSLVATIRDRFGRDSMRVTRTHAKFTVIENREWKVALRSSMNLNQNPRLESFEVGHDPALARFLITAMHDVWERQPRSLQDATHGEQTDWWKRHG
jgi:hypothetical protein